MLSTVNKGFSGWLQGELDKREWTQADLARKSDLSRAAVSQVISQNRKPGPEFCRAVAKALELPEEFVFRKAGLLSPQPDKPEDPPTFWEWIMFYLKASEEDRDRMLEMAEQLAKQKNEEGKEE